MFAIIEGYGSSIMMCLIGIAIIVVAIYHYQYRRRYFSKENRIEVDALVLNKRMQERQVEDGQRYTYVFKYNVDGEQYETEYRDSSESNCSVGDIIKIYCNKDNPKEITMPNDVVWAAVMEIGFIVIGIGGILAGIRQGGWM